MIELLRRNPLVAALAVLCAALAAVIALELATMGQSGEASESRKVAANEPKLLPPLAPVSPEAVYPETAARPLWIPTRRPAPPPVVAQASFQRGQFALHGVIIAGGTRIALLKEKTGGRVHRVEQGREVNGLQVSEIQPGQVTLAQGGELEVVELLVQTPGGAAGAKPQAVARPTASLPATSGPFATAPAIVPTPAGVPPTIPPGPMPPSRSPASPAATPPGATPPGAAPPGAPPPNPSPGAVPQQTAAPMTPEELLARRRARRNPSP